MAREVNVFTSNRKKTGVNVTINWIDNNGVAQTRSEILKFPNFLNNVSADDLKEWLTELMIREARQRLVV